MPWFKNMYHRATDPKGAKLFLAVAFLQAMVIIGLEAMVLFENMQQWDPIVGTATTTDLADDTVVGRAWLRFIRIRWENVAFMLFQIWVIWLSVDGVIEHNIVEIVAIAIINALCTVAAAIQISDNAKWINMFRSSDRVSYGDLVTAQKVEIALTVMIILFAMVFGYLSYRLSGELMWKVFKKLGADDARKSMYRNYQMFLLCLKVDVFFEFVLSLFYITTKSPVQVWDLGLIIVVCVTALSLPSLVWARIAVRMESRWMMWIFMSFQLLVIGHLILILWDTFEIGERWYSWIFMVILGVIIALATFVFGHLCTRYFGRGLKQFVQSIKIPVYDAEQGRKDIDGPLGQEVKAEKHNSKRWNFGDTYHEEEIVHFGLSDADVEAYDLSYAEISAELELEDVELHSPAPGEEDNQEVEHVDLDGHVITIRRSREASPTRPLSQEVVNATAAAESAQQAEAISASRSMKHRSDEQWLGVDRY